MKAIFLLFLSSSLFFTLFACSSAPTYKKDSKPQIDDGANTYSATESEPDEESDESASASEVKSPLETDILTLEAKKLFTEATAAQNSGHYSECSLLWRKYTNDFIGYPDYNEALFRQAECLIEIDHSSEALTVLKEVSEHKENSFFNRSKLLLAKCYYNQAQYEEAVSSIQEYLKLSGTHLTPQALAESYLLEGNALLAKGEWNEAMISLMQAAKNLDPTNQAGKLATEVYFSTARALTKKCTDQNPLPTKISEEIFEQFQNNYYSCINELKTIGCQVMQSCNLDATCSNRLGAHFKESIEWPKALTENLPQAAREFKKEKQKLAFDKEMRQIILLTIGKKSHEFKSLPACQKYDLF